MRNVFQNHFYLFTTILFPFWTKSNDQIVNEIDDHTKNGVVTSMVQNESYDTITITSV